MNSFNAGDLVTVKTSGKSCTVVAAYGAYVMVRTATGVQWTYAREELQAA